MSEPTITEAELVEGYGTEIVPAPVALFKTDDPVEVIEQAGKVADALAGVIRAKGLSSSIQGKEHVRVEGWQLLGVMLGVTAVCVHTEPVDGGFKATVEARTADGRVIGRADALCTKHEKRGPWKTADDYARLSMAQTRATSKALKGPLGFVVSLAGYQTTPAEEMTFAEPEAAPASQRSGGQSRQPTAAAAQGTERPASAKQRGLINARAAEHHMPASVLANVVLAATGNEPRDFASDDAAQEWLKRGLDRLPARTVNAVLAGIEKEASPA